MPELRREDIIMAMDGVHAAPAMSTMRSRNQKWVQIDTGEFDISARVVAPSF
jgi:hypothetical protein